ncbi:MAG TPA: TetR/AcrR family transcriptional regulator, partial [Solirubrobacterales bacterium]|nr:TetR/AcrR family transcriptional regulator [Solirubrobacterales bacterium]
RGRHGLTREYVAEDQKKRILTATAEILDEYAYEGTTVAAISGRAGVSKSDFYVHFASKDVCFVAAYDAGVLRLRGDVLTACGGGTDWGDGVCSGLEAALARLAAQPAQANLLLVEGLRAGPGICARFQQAIESFVPHLRKGAPPGTSGRRSPETADEAVVGGIASLLGRRVLAGKADRLERFFPELAEFALTPYLGVAEARRIISSR